MALPPAFEQQITFLYAEDLAPCRHFYGTVLGLPLVQDQGAAAIYATGGSRGFLGVVQACGPREGSDPRRQGGVVVTFVTPEIAAWHDHLAAAGVPIEAPPRRSAALGITHFFIRDPAGYLLEVQRFDRPDWPRPA